MKKITPLLIIIMLSAIYSHAQITGSTTVCAGYIYSYSANIAGAATYTWTLPNGWYGLTGQGTSQIIVTCNGNDGVLSAEGFNPNGISVGVQTLSTQFNAGSGWNVNPGTIIECAMQTIQQSTSVSSNGTGGGAGCPTGCGNGTLHPNIGYAIYDNPWPSGIFASLIGGTLFMPFAPATYYVYKIDYTNGYIPGSQAILIDGGCGNATVSNTIQLIPTFPLPISFTQNPVPSCVGDTITIDAINMATYLWTAQWGATLLNNGISPVSVVIDSASASVDVTGLDQSGCLNQATYNINVSPCINSCLVAYYPLNGNYYDVSGNNLNAIWHGATSAPDRFGTPNSAYHFNGLSQWLELPTDFDYPKRTWSLWFYADTITTGYHQIFDADHANLQYAQTEMFLHEQNGADSLYMSVGDASTGFKMPVNEKQWYHAAIVRDSSVIRYYFNGCLQDTVIISSNYNNHSQNGMQTVGLGCDRFHTGMFFRGSMDDVRIYQCALSGSEINILADSMCNPLSIASNENNVYDFFIFPNPANEFISVKSNLKSPVALQIFNSLGAMVFEKKNFISEINIPVGNFSKGVYTIKVSNSAKRFLKY